MFNELRSAVLTWYEWAEWQTCLGNGRFCEFYFAVIIANEQCSTTYRGCGGLNSHIIVPPRGQNLGSGTSQSANHQTVKLWCWRMVPLRGSGTSEMNFGDKVRSARFRQFRKLPCGTFLGSEKAWTTPFLVPLRGQNKTKTPDEHPDLFIWESPPPPLSSWCHALCWRALGIRKSILKWPMGVAASIRAWPRRVPRKARKYTNSVGDCFIMLHQKRFCLGWKF